MGLNYYIRYNACECCERYDEHHVGKASLGWKFCFQGPVYGGQTLSIGDELVPVPETRDAWFKLFDLEGVSIWDEEGRRVHRIALSARIESRQGEESHALLYPERGWEDEEGYAFSGDNFE